MANVRYARYPVLVFEALAPTAPPALGRGGAAGARPGVLTRLLTGQPAGITELALTQGLTVGAAAWAAAARAGGTRSRSADPRPDWADAHPLAMSLDGARPGPELAATLAALEPAEVDDAALVEAIAAWERVASWATARQAHAVNELRRRREGQRREAFVGDEIAARLGTTRAGGESKVLTASSLERLPEVSDALERGDIDHLKARVICDEVMPLGDAEAHRVAAAVLPRASVLTGPQLRSRIRRMELAQHPLAAEERHRAAVADRFVDLQPARDGMAWLNAYLPADQGVAVYTTLTALADAAAPDDPRPIAARRADALVDLVTPYLDAGVGPDGRALPVRQGRRPHLQVTASATTLLGLDEQPGELAGYGPIPASMARAIAAGATWRPVLVDERTGELRGRGPIRYRPSSDLVARVVDRDLTCTFPGCRVPAARCDIDHIEPFDPARPPDQQTRAPNLHALCRHHHLLKTHGGWQVMRDDDAGATEWTAPTGHGYARAPTEVGAAERAPDPETVGAAERAPDVGPPPF